jgi:F-type H+-transporting ATPase subunit b
MDINATLLGQMLVFGILIWFSWKFIWPPLTKAVEDRQKKIAEGLAAAERGQTELQTAHGEAQVIINAARDQAKKIVDQAHKREVEIVDEARSTALEEGKRIVDSSRQDAAQESPAPATSCARTWPAWPWPALPVCCSERSTRRPTPT